MKFAYLDDDQKKKHSDRILNARNRVLGVLREECRHEGDQTDVAMAIEVACSVICGLAKIVATHRSVADALSMLSLAHHHIRKNTIDIADASDTGVSENKDPRDGKEEDIIRSVADEICTVISRADMNNEMAYEALGAVISSRLYAISNVDSPAQAKELLEWLVPNLVRESIFAIRDGEMDRTREKGLS